MAAPDYLKETLRGAISSLRRAQDDNYGADGITQKQWREWLAIIESLSFRLADLTAELPLAQGHGQGVSSWMRPGGSVEIVEALRNVGTTAHNQLM